MGGTKREMGKTKELSRKDKEEGNGESKRAREGEERKASQTAYRLQNLSQPSRELQTAPRGTIILFFSFILFHFLLPKT